MEKTFSIIRIFSILAILAISLQASAQTISVRDSIMALEGDTMPEPFRILPELFVTPDGSSPEDYILNKVAQKAKENRKTLNYTADMVYYIYASNMDLLPEFLGKTGNWFMKTAMGFMGIKALYNYITSNEEAAIGVSVTHLTKKGDTKFKDGKIIYCPAEMPEKVGKQVIGLAENSLFDELYGNKHLFNEKKRHKVYDEIKYIGTAEEPDGTLYYVIRIRHEVGTKRQWETTLHITDGTWGILRKQHKSQHSSIYVECKNFSGVYLPVKCVEDPTPMSMEEFTRDAREALTKNVEPDEEMNKYARKMLERMEKLANGERRNAPMTKYTYDVTYR